MLTKFALTQYASLSLNPQTGAWTLSTPLGSIGPGGCEMSVNGRNWSVLRDSRVKTKGNAILCTSQKGTLRAEVTFSASDNAPWIEIRAQVRNVGKAVTLEYWRPILAGKTKIKLPTTRRLNLLINGEWIANGTTSLARLDDDARLSGQIKGPKVGWWFATVAADSSSPCLLLAYGDPVTHGPRFLADGPKFVAENDMRWDLAKGEEVETDALRLGWFPNVHDALAAHREELPEPPKTLTEPMIGWNSWDYYFTDIALEDIRENMAAIRRMPWLRKKVRYIVIDDGWQTRHGEWEANHRFPDGMKATADAIRSAGFIPGIWTAPFSTLWMSRIGLHRPDWSVKGIDGEPVWKSLMALDPTHPEVQDFLRETFRRLYEDGYRYFKVDFLSYVNQAHRFHDPKAGRAEGLRRGLQVIREAIGPDSILLGCGLPKHSGAGIVDAARISGDISTYWSTITGMVRQIAAAYFLHGRPWFNDPDFLIIRNPATADDDQHNPYLPPKPYVEHESRTGPPTSTVEEAQVWASIVLLSGGSVMLADRISKLNDSGLEILRTFFEEYTTNAAIPVDLMDRALPRIWVQKNEDHVKLGLFNWTDKPARITVNGRVFGDICELPDSGTAKDIWTCETHEIYKGALSIDLASRSVALLRIAPRGARGPRPPRTQRSPGSESAVSAAEGSHE